MIMSLRGNQRSLHTRQNLFCLRQRQPQIGDLGKAGGSIDLYQVDTICRDVGACFDQSQNPTHARSPGQKDKDRRIAPGPIPPISGQSPSQAGKPLVYLDYLEVAPWNRPDFGPVPRLRGVGSALITAAVALSDEEGFKGRLGLHSLPQADAFYRKIGMTDLGPDPAYQNLRYFEMTVEQARTFLEGEQDR